MGGKALKYLGIETERKTTSEFLKIARFFQNKVETELGVETHVVEFYRKKITHGDLDLLIKIDNPFNLKEYIEDNINTKGIHNNGGVLSFEYDNFQIDFIPIRQSVWEVAKTFFDWDPTGNLMGKTAHKFGAKYGIEGLILPVRNFNGRISKNITLSKDVKKIFEFLGYDYNRYLQGFDTKEEIFDWTINSKYFDSEMFKMENLNNVDRKRNKKRQTYQEFIQYLKTNNINKSFDFKDKIEYIKILNEFFPNVGLKKELEDLEKKDKENKQVADKFNGRIIMNKYDWLKGKKLGDAIRDFKGNFTNFREYVLKNDSEHIMKDFDEWIIQNK